MDGEAVDEVHVHHQRAQYELIAQGHVVHPVTVYVFHQVVTPGGNPLGTYVSVPVEVVGIGILGARGNRGGAELEENVLAGSRRPRGRYPESVILIQVVGKSSVIINVNGRGVNLVAADENGLFARRDGPLGVDLPFEPEEIRGVERVALVYLLVEPLPDAQADVVSQVAENMQIEVVSLEVRSVLAGPHFLMESGAGVYGNLVHMAFDGLEGFILRFYQRAAQDQCRNQNQF